jgi:hypothetical protein
LNRENLANKVSDVFNPLYVSTVFLFIVSVHTAQTTAEALRLWAITSFFFSFLPLMDLNRRIKKGQVSDAHITDRGDRVIPFLVSLFSAVAGLTAVYVLDMPAAIKAVSLSVVLAGALITTITTIWKISLHAAAISAIVTVFVILFGLVALPTVLFIPLVFWARIALGKHTIAQLFAGSAAAIAVTLAVFNVFELI